MFIDPTLKKRIKAYQLFKRGLGLEQIAKKLRIDGKTVKHWISLIAAQGGPQALNISQTSQLEMGQLLSVFIIGAQILAIRKILAIRFFYCNY
jgi:uncharacterized protein YpbB